MTSPHRKIDMPEALWAMMKQFREAQADVLTSWAGKIEEELLQDPSVPDAAVKLIPPALINVLVDLSVQLSRLHVDHDRIPEFFAELFNTHYARHFLAKNPALEGNRLYAGQEISADEAIDLALKSKGAVH